MESNTEINTNEWLLSQLREAISRPQGKERKKTKHNTNFNLSC